ncbi:response regulator transcription factor [Brevundimonas diminuta]|uniref:response regulator transcription factor n=1 Tax=Brevundimonas diminuta TaxID=293 RepID=UPI003CFD5E00
MKVLFLEDDDAWAAMVELAVDRAGGTTQRCTAIDQLLAAADDRWDVIVLDRMIEGDSREGLDALAAIRQRGMETPVLMLTHLGGGDQVAGSLTMGADDYLTKPFDAVELVARLRNLMRRGGGWASPQVMKYAKLELRPLLRIAHWDNREIRLSRQTFDILRLLMENQGQVVSRQALWSEVWSEWSPDPRVTVLEAALYRLREDLRRAGTPPLIHTVRRVGYMLEIRANEAS